MKLGKIYQNTFSLLLALALVLPGCGKKDDDSDESAESGINDDGDPGQQSGENDQGDDGSGVRPGDILYLTEDEDKTLWFSKEGEFKGYAFDSTDLTPWYAYGLRLSYDSVEDEYYPEMGSGNDSLAIEVKRFDAISYPYELKNYEAGPASDAQYFQGAFSEENNGVRHVATGDGSNIKVFVHGQETANCAVAMPAGKYARALYSGTQSGADTYVAYTLGTGSGVTGYGVGKLSGTCKSVNGSPASLVQLFEDTDYSDAKITSVLHVRTAEASSSSSWKGSIFVTVGSFLSGQKVAFWKQNAGTWSQQANPFKDLALAVFQLGEGDLYTVELEDLWDDALHLRRYFHTAVDGEHLAQTLFSDPTQETLKDSSLGNWLIVLPEL